MYEPAKKTPVMYEVKITGVAEHGKVTTIKTLMRPCDYASLKHCENIIFIQEVEFAD